MQTGKTYKKPIVNLKKLYDVSSGSAIECLRVHNTLRLDWKRGVDTWNRQNVVDFVRFRKLTDR